MGTVEEVEEVKEIKEVKERMRDNPDGAMLSPQPPLLQPRYFPHLLNLLVFKLHSPVAHLVVTKLLHCAGIMCSGEDRLDFTPLFSL